MLRLRPTNQPMILGEAFPELVMVNGHAGQVKLQLYAGLFRLVCLNGLVTGTHTNTLVIKHSGDLEAILAEAQRVIKSAQQQAKAVEKWLHVVMTKNAMINFAKQAMVLAYGQDRSDAFDASKLLVARRDVDKAPDLWHVFNVVQENVMRGGIEYRTATDHAAQTRGFSNLPHTIEFNKGLWELAEKAAV